MNYLFRTYSRESKPAKETDRAVWWHLWDMTDLFSYLSVVGLHLPPPLRGHCPCYPPGDSILGVRSPFRFIVCYLASILGECLPPWVSCAVANNRHAHSLNSKAAKGVNSFPRATITE